VGDKKSTLGGGQEAVDVKTGKVQMKDLTGLLEFTRRHPAFGPLVICSAGGLATAERAESPAITWQEFLLAGPAGTEELVMSRASQSARVSARRCPPNSTPGCFEHRRVVWGRCEREV
jgi:hypothetical protein